MRKILLFALAGTVALFLSCSADNPSDDGISSEDAINHALSGQSPDGQTPVQGGSGGGGATGACYASDGIDDVCVDGVSEEGCRNQAGAYFDYWEEGESCD